MGEMQGVSQLLRGREKRTADLKGQCTEAERLLRDFEARSAQEEQELQRERERVEELHREALALREACIVPAQLKRKSAALVRSLEGGQVDTERRARGLQTAVKLYDAVSSRAPALETLATKALADVEEGINSSSRL